MEIQGPRELRSKKPANLALAVGVNVASGKPLWAEGPNYELPQAFFPERDPTASGRDPD